MIKLHKSNPGPIEIHLASSNQHIAIIATESSCLMGKSHTNGPFSAIKLAEG